jgi:CDP-glucose 4,6-dehydratase
MVSPSFWKTKKVLVTGHTGFKGGWLSLWLQHMGASIAGYALPAPTVPSLYEVGRVSEGMASITGDIRNLDGLLAVVAEHKPEIVFHLAAQPLVRYSYLNPIETYSTNVLGTVHIFEAVRRTLGVRVVVNVTSDKCYENREWIWGYREGDPLGGSDPYSNSKGCAEMVTNAYRRSFFAPAEIERHGVALASVRAGNVIGGGDWAADRLVPDIMRAFLAGEPAQIRRPEAIRPWQHVLEPVSGYLLLAQRLWDSGAAFASAWNFGPDLSDAKPVSWIADRLSNEWAGAARWTSQPGKHVHEAQQLMLDCSKARLRLGWRPRWTLERALTAVVEWFRAYQTGLDLREVTLAQIDAYNRSGAAESPRIHEEGGSPQVPSNQK